jgi:hypothetical protein
LNESVISVLDCVRNCSENYCILPCCEVTKLFQRVLDQLSWRIPPLLDHGINVQSVGFEIFVSHLSNLDSINLESLLVDLILFEREAVNIQRGDEASIVVNAVKRFIAEDVIIELSE